MKFSTLVRDHRFKWLTLSGVMLLTVGLHYGLILDRFFGHTAWTHAIHSRFCYIPIVVAATWFGVRGGLISAAAISLMVVPLLFGPELSTSHLSTEIVEIVFYFAVGLVIGWLSDRERALRQQHEEARVQLERSHKLSLVGQMAAGVAHEIKNPLASIKGAIEILTDPQTSQAEKEEFKQLLPAEVHRIDGRVVEFLQLARPKEAHLQPLLVTSLVRNLIRQLDAQFAQSRLQVLVDIDEDLWIMGDGERLHQVLLNLLLNAADASAPGSTIAVHASRDENSVRLTVSDQGNGISDVDRARIFEPFFTTKPSGAGLGLPIVKSIVEQHRGDIQLISEPDKGTIAQVILPACDAKAEAQCI